MARSNSQGSCANIAQSLILKCLGGCASIVFIVRSVPGKVVVSTMCRAVVFRFGDQGQGPFKNHCDLVRSSANWCESVRCPSTRPPDLSRPLAARRSPLDILAIGRSSAVRAWQSFLSNMGTHYRTKMGLA